MQSSTARSTGINETNRTQQQNNNLLTEGEDENTNEGAQVSWSEHKCYQSISLNIHNSPAGSQDPDENEDGEPCADINVTLHS